MMLSDSVPLLDINSSRYYTRSMLIAFALLFLVSSYLLLAAPVAAQCPVCIVTVGGGMLLAQKLGIDDLLVSIWISALNTVFSFYLAGKVKVKFLNNPLILSALMYALTMVYFVTTDQVGVASNQILGLDKIFLGQTLGLVFTILGNMIYFTTKRRNGGKALFPYSKVVFPVGSVILITIFFKLVFKL